MAKYFHGVSNLDELKARYRELCKKYHPDLGGDLQAMQEINCQYEEILKTGQFLRECEEKNTSFEIESCLREVIEKTCVFKNIVIEICGRWIWFTGETWRYKKLLKEYGCLWSSKKCAWYWRPETEKRFSKRGIPLELIRKKYGTKVVPMSFHEEIS